MIYYVEDEENIRELVIYTLNQTGVESRGFAEAAPFYEALKAEKPSLVLLDIMLPGEDGLTILKKLRSNPDTSGIPVMMLTAKGTEFDKVAGLDLGADDYLAKPFGMAELVARVKALLRRSEKARPKGEGPLVSGGLRLDPGAHRVYVGGIEAVLTLKEYSLLYMLFSHPGRAYTREQLLTEIWGFDYDGGTRTVDVHVQTLRTKLGSEAGHIGTVRGVGYRFEE